MRKATYSWENLIIMSRWVQIDARLDLLRLVLSQTPKTRPAATRF